MRTLWKLGLGSVSLLVAACTSSSPSGADAGDSGPATTNTFKCGSGSATGISRATDVVTLGPIAGATLSAPGCTTATTDDRGYLQVAVDPGVLLKLSVMADGYVNAYAEFTVLKGGFNETGSDYKKSDITGVAPQWSTSMGYVFVAVGGDGSDGGPCSTAMGAAVSIDGHPELKPSYLKDLKTIDPNGTSPEGFGTLFGPMPPGAYSVSATKAGCKTVSGGDEYFSYTTTTTVLANFVSLAPIRIAP